MPPYNILYIKEVNRVVSPPARVHHCSCREGENKEKNLLLCHLICDESVVDMYVEAEYSSTTTCFCVNPAEEEPAPNRTQSRKEMTTNRTGSSFLKWSLTGSDRSLVFVTETVSAWEAWWDSGRGAGFCLNEIRPGPRWRLHFCCVLGWAFNSW